MASESSVRGLILREIVVDVFGNLMPGTLFVGTMGVLTAWPVLAFVEVARITVPDAARLEVGVVTALTGLLAGAAFPVAIVLLIAAYVLGHLFYRQDIKVPDKRSFRRIRSTVTVEPWVARDDAECEFPYANLRGYLEARGLTDLAVMVPWKPPAAQPSAAAGPARTQARTPARAAGPPSRPTSVQRTKTFINGLKLRILNHRPASFGPIARNEAHVRLNSSTWYMARAVERLSWLMLGLSLLLSAYLWQLHAAAGAPQHLVWLPAMMPALGIVLSRWIRRKIENVLHYQRVREVIHVLETAHILFRGEPHLIADLCPGVASWQRPWGAGRPASGPGVGGVLVPPPIYGSGAGAGPG